MTEIINISRLHFPVTTLGPGNRVGIWLQGCSIRCRGCISADTWGEGKGTTTVQQVVETVSPWMTLSDGITISGGEPFDQPRALVHLIRTLKSVFDTNVLVFSGYPIEEIEATLSLANGLIDALISDPFEIELPQTKALRGSDNQRLHLLTKLGADKFACFERPSSVDDKRFDLMLDDEGTAWLSGIPGRDDFSKLRGILEDSGNAVITSEAVVRSTRNGKERLA